MDKKLVIFEMANNHMGDVDHGKLIIEEFAKVKDKYPDFNYAMKFQLRHIDTFIHPHFQNRTEIKYVKRFKETQLPQNQFNELKRFAEAKGFTTICTGFDEKSVDTMEAMNFPIIKVASCSFTDWPLLNRIAETDVPIIASTAGSNLEDIDNVVSFFLNRKKDLTIMHCIGEYPTSEGSMQLNQLKLLKNRYPGIKVGYSTHEDPTTFDIAPIAIGMGADALEKHVGVATDDYALNVYSVSPEQMDKWLENATRAVKACGITEGRHAATDKELSDLRTFKRGVFLNRDVAAGEVITKEDVYYAFPCKDKQILANDMSKYVGYTAKVDMAKDEGLLHYGVKEVNTRQAILTIRNKVNHLLERSGVVVPKDAPLEISHHYGIKNFYETGLCMVTVVNEGYCKKLLISLANQEHPTQYHEQKTETFVVLHGEVNIALDGEERTMYPGEVVTIQPGVRHQFTGGPEGSIIEEISTTHFVDDSYYTDESISKNKNRKTMVSHWVN
jgi:sialic acid synthase SpsE/mannose-6-phosphate isomerase-like protein (cupin superfamily)